MILAAGKGTRLYPLTINMPKILLPLAGISILEHNIIWLKKYDISEIIINLHHFGNRIKDFLGDGSDFGIKVCYSPEETLLGTAGGVKNVESFIDFNLLVVYGDVIGAFDLNDMLRFHHSKNSIATLALLQRTNTQGCGVVEVNRQGRISSFIEKPDIGTATGNLTNGGIYLLEKEALKYIPEHKYSDFAYNVFPDMLKKRLPIYGYIVSSEEILDTGTMGKYQQLSNTFHHK